MELPQLAETNCLGMEWVLGSCVGRLYFPKMAITLSALPHALLTMWPSHSPPQEVGSIFPPLEPGWACGDYFGGDTMWFLRLDVKRWHGVYLLLSWGVHSRKPATMLWRSPSYHMDRPMCRETTSQHWTASRVRCAILEVDPPASSYPADTMWSRGEPFYEALSFGVVCYVAVDSWNRGALWKELCFLSAFSGVLLFLSLD